MTNTPTTDDKYGWLDDILDEIMYLDSEDRQKAQARQAIIAKLEQMEAE